MQHKGLKEPHLLNAGPNAFRLIKNLAGILLPVELTKLQKELDTNVAQLFRLGEAHYSFAVTVPATEWRQKVSRLYYAAYNVRRAVALNFDGAFSTDSSDHARVDMLPDAFPQAASYRTRLKNLRDDRNLADYSHLATDGDLFETPVAYEKGVSEFISECRQFLAQRGINV